MKRHTRMPRIVFPIAMVLLTGIARVGGQDSLVISRQVPKAKARIGQPRAGEEPRPVALEIMTIGHPIAVVQEVPARQPADAEKEAAAKSAPALPSKKLDAWDETVIRITTTPPSSQDLFRMETEEAFRQRLAKETERWRDRIQIPDFVAPMGGPLVIDRGWPNLTARVESNRLCYFRLFFDQPFSERYGQSFGCLQPLVSTSIFYGDLATWPLRAVAPPHWRQCDDLSDLTGLGDR